MDKAATIASAYALTATSFLIILCRTSLRLLRHEKFHLDDFFTLIAVVLYTLFTASYSVTVNNGINILQTNPKSLKDAEIEDVIFGSKWILIGRLLHLSYLWILKCCLLIFFKRLLSEKWERIALKIGHRVLAYTWLACMLTILLECRPFSLYWQVVPDTPECAKALAASVLFGVTDIATNLLVMLIPVPHMIQSDALLLMKFHAFVLYIIGVFIITVSALRIAMAFGALNQQNQLIWDQLECFLATIVANTPIIFCVWRHAWAHIKKLKFGKEHCPPEYNLAIRAATGSRDSDQEQGERRATRRSRSQSRKSEGLRKSIQKIGERMRISIEELKIERNVVMLQESKTGSLERSEPGEQQLFMGASVGCIAHISTEICADAPSQPKRTMFAGLRREERRRTESSDYPS